MMNVRPAGNLLSSSKSVFDWLTGASFLMLHATCFFVTLVVMIPWNLYSEPGDFWVASPLTKWAFLLAFHALLVGAWSLIRNVILKDPDSTELSDPSNRMWFEARVHAARANDGAPVRVPRHVVPPTVEASSNGWNSPAIGGPASRSQAEAQVRLSDTGLQQTSAASFEAWVQPREELEQSDSRLLQETADQPIVDGQPLASHARSHGPLSAAARVSGGSKGGGELDPELEWHWIEAAASAWLNRKEEEVASHSDIRVRNAEGRPSSHS